MGYDGPAPVAWTAVSPLSPPWPAGRPPPSRCQSSQLRRASERRGIRTEPLLDEGIRRAVFLHAADGLVQPVPQPAIVLPHADAYAGPQPHLWADESQPPSLPATLSRANSKSTNTASAPPMAASS